MEQIAAVACAPGERRSDRCAAHQRILGRNTQRKGPPTFRERDRLAGCTNEQYWPCGCSVLHRSMGS